MFDYNTMSRLDDATKYVMKYFTVNFDESEGAQLTTAINDINYVFYGLRLDSITFYK